MTTREREHKEPCRHLDTVRTNSMLCVAERRRRVRVAWWGGGTTVRRSCTVKGDFVSAHLRPLRSPAAHTTGQRLQYRTRRNEATRAARPVGGRHWTDTFDRVALPQTTPARASLEQHGSQGQWATSCARRCRHDHVRSPPRMHCPPHAHNPRTHCRQGLCDRAPCFLAGPPELHMLQEVAA